jgi:hypothetical protein
MWESNRIQTTFIDLATYGEKDKYMYGGPQPPDNSQLINHGIWESSNIIELQKTNAVNDYWNKMFHITRKGDFLSYVFVDIKLPTITCKKPGCKIFWSKNLAHNICKQTKLISNEECILKISHYDLDFNMNYNMSKEKHESYNYYIGNRDELTSPQENLPETILCLPLPLPFSKDRTENIPVCATPYSDMNFSIMCRKWDELLTMIDVNGIKTIPTSDDIIIYGEIELRCYASYIITNGDSRHKSGCKKLKFIYESFENRVWTINPTLFQDKFCHNFDFDEKSKEYLNILGPIKSIYFAVRDTSSPNEWSIYLPKAIQTFSLYYGNHARTLEVPSHHYGFVHPYFHSNGIQERNGMCMYTYCLGKIDAIKCGGSTNYSELKSNVSIACSYLIKDVKSCDMVFSFVKKEVIIISGGAVGIVTDNTYNITKKDY